MVVARFVIAVMTRISRKRDRPIGVDHHARPICGL